MALRIFFATRSNLKPAFRTTNLQAGFYSSKSQPEIPKNQLEGLITADQQKSNGVCYDKKPFKMVLQAGKNYSWCLCGKGHSQPLCDGTHKNQFLKIEQKPVRFQVAETKEYWLCNCKQTKNRPFCDGTHLTKQVEEMTSTIKP